MQPGEFNAPEAGRVIQTPQGYHAFVPAALPPVIDYNPSLVRLLSVADVALSELSGLGQVLPSPNLLIAPYIRRPSRWCRFRSVRACSASTTIAACSSQSFAIICVPA